MQEIKLFFSARLLVRACRQCAVLLGCSGFCWLVSFSSTLPAFAMAVRQTDETHQALCIVTATAGHNFTVEIANDEHERRIGLMHRHHLPADAGMLFDFGPRERHVSMWMKNTYIALDMLFIARDGTIVHIAPNQDPLSLTAITYDRPVKGLLELNGGTVARLELKPGDRVWHHIFTPPRATAADAREKCTSAP